MLFGPQYKDALKIVIQENLPKHLLYNSTFLDILNFSQNRKGEDTILYFGELYVSTHPIMGLLQLDDSFKRL